MAERFQQASYDHQQVLRIGVLLVNLGTPDAPTAAAVRPYLKQFLSDRRVVEVPRWIWWLVLNGIILPFRSGRSAKAYAKVWRQDGSPLLVLSQRLSAGLARHPGLSGTSVALAMTYGRPGIPEVLAALQREGIDRLLVLPLYPQYSATTTASVFDAVTSALQRQRWLPELRFVNQYFQHPEWSAAVAESIRAYQQVHGSGDKLLFSFHGIPQRYFRQGDPYYCQCHASARLIAEQLGLSADAWQVSFQSRLGREPWLQPYTDQWLQQFARDGGRRVQVVCPGFAVDCLETLEEIAMENQELFVAAGGQQLDYIPALNDSRAQIDMLAGILQLHLQHWPALSTDNDGQRRQRALRRAELDDYPLPLVDGNTSTGKQR